MIPLRYFILHTHKRYNMSAIQTAIRHVKSVIPKEVLEIAFGYINNNRYKTTVSIDSRIKTTVIDEKVLPDCNIVGGVEVTIAMNGLTYEQLDTALYAYRIPKALTQGRSITSVLSVAFANLNAYQATANVAPSQQTDLVQGAAVGYLQTLSPIPYMSEARATLIGDNVVTVETQMVPGGNLYLRCIIENDYNMTNINRKSWLKFSELVEYAVKSWIYTNTIVSIDRAYVDGGADIGSIKDIIEGYSDAEQNYKDFLSKNWSSVSILNDPEQHERMVRLTSGGRW